MPKIALLICLILIIHLFILDFKKPYQPTNAIWIPFLWMFIAGSRYVSSWLNLSVPMSSANDYSEGSPVDRVVFFSLILMGAFILKKRHINWNILVRQNKLILVYLLYALSSILWSDNPFVLFKRWVKDIGNPIMALVILTEPRPYDAIGVVLRRLSFLFLPLSILFVKYFPDLGRTIHVDGAILYTGVGHQKNDLGAMCLITGIYFAWEIILNKKIGLEVKERNNIFYYLLIIMLIWLLRLSDSQTSLFTLMVTIGLFLLSRIGFITNKPSRIIPLLICSSLLLYVLEAGFHVKDIVFDMMGRDPSLTNRTELWKVVLSFEVNPVIGAGFMSFWTGERMEMIAVAMKSEIINQAHNGYLEQYLNLGYIGLVIIILILTVGMFKIQKFLDINNKAGMLRLGFLISAIIVNYTEASFYGINNLWVLLIFSVIDISGQENKKGMESVVTQKVEQKTMYKKYYRYKRNSPQNKL